MDNAAKLEAIREWIDPEERVTVDFLDEKGLTAMVTGCTAEHVDLLLETRFLHLKQHVCVPMSQEKPLRHSRLRLIILEKRPQWL